MNNMQFETRYGVYREFKDGYLTFEGSGTTMSVPQEHLKSVALLTPDEVMATFNLMTELLLTGAVNL